MRILPRLPSPGAFRSCGAGDPI